MNVVKRPPSLKMSTPSSLPVYTSLPTGEGEASAGRHRTPSPFGKRSVPTRLIVRSLIAFAALVVVVFFFVVPQPTVVKDAVESIRNCASPKLSSASTSVGIHQDMVDNKTPASDKPSKIIKLTFAYGKGSIDPTGQKSGMDETREQLLQGHIDHARMHGYRQYIQRTNIMNDIRTKPATALQIVLEELQKPQEQRAEWIVQHDADMVVYNYQFPLETFLPPADRSDIHLMVTQDGNGMNTGCIYMRVSPLMAQMLGGNIMYDLMPGNRAWNFAEQGMLENMVQDIKLYNASTVIMPKHWVNAYPPGWEGGFKSGDWILHTVAWSKADLPKYVKEAAERKPENQISPAESGIEIEVEEFWRKMAAERGAATQSQQHKRRRQIV